ncbi:MAG: septum site-determining protein MinC [Acetobacteraceae bacterium]|nr:septum site-determining protein MinC [Acetobacteraceae bacterium]
MRLRGRSFMAVVLMPDPPVEAWLEQLDAQLARSPKFFDGRAVLLDFTALAGQERSFPALLDELKRRHIRIVGVEGVDPHRFGDDMPPVLSGGRHVSVTADEPPPPEIKQAEPLSLVVAEPVRSGQSIHFPAGDVTVVGSVASGSEIVAGGSIHVYGTLRGRAIAGLLGAASRPRIFCRRLDAELLAIDGVYRTADEIDPALQGRGVQAWLEGDQLRVAALD